MSMQDDRPDDAPTEWLSPALYRQLCDAVDAALFAPPDARDALLAARLGSDQRLLAEARALLASHESSPRTFISPAMNAGSDETFVGADESATMIRRDSATVIVPGSGSRRAYEPPTADSDGTQEMRALSDPPPPSSLGLGSGASSSSGTVTLRPPQPASPTADTSPRVPIAQEPPSLPGAPRPLAAEAAPPMPSRPAWGPPVAINQPPPPMPDYASAPAAKGPVPEPDAPPVTVARPAAPRPPASPPSAPVAAAAKEPPRAAAPTPVRSIDIGAPIPTRPSGGSALQLIGFALAGLLLLVAGGTLWMWRQAGVAQQDAEARLAKAEKRFTEVRQLGTRLAEVDRLLAVTPDAGAQAARAVLLRTWMQYLTDLQRASGSTERELLIEVARGYRQLAAAQGGLSGRTLGDRAGATRTLQIAENLWSYLDRNSAQPEGPVLQELIATHVDLGDLHSVAKDAGKASAQYQKALQAAGRLSGAGVSSADARRLTDMIRQRIQSGPPSPAPAVVDAAPITASEEP
jgi:hypothetical protein